MTNERLLFLIRKNQGRLNMPCYIEELNKLVHDNDYKIIGLEESDRIMGKIKENSRKYSNIKQVYTELPFNDRSILKTIVRNVANDGKCFMSIGYSEMCGISELNDINHFNVDFRFEDEHTGTIILYSYDLDNELLIDFYEEYSEYYMDIELYGYRWNQFML